MWSIPVSVDIQIEGRRGGGREGAILLGECQESNINVPARARVGVCIGQKVQRKIPGQLGSHNARLIPLFTCDTVKSK